MAQYAELYDLPPANRTKLSKFLVDAARNKRLLPVTVVPVSGPRGSPVDIPVFSGDSPMAAVARVAQEMERREGGPSGGAGGSGGGGAEWREAAVRVVDRAAVAQKLRWAAQAVVGVQGEEHKVQLWFGESAEEKARGFAERVGLGAAEREAVAAELRRQAEAVGAVPVVWERVNAGSAPALFELFHGEDVGRRAADFVAAQGWDEVYGGVLARRAKELAMSKGALPVVALGGTVRGKPFEVRVYAGDDAEEVLGRFAERYKLPAADSKFLVDSLAAKMQARIDAVKS